MELREKVAALTNSVDLLKKESIKKEVRIIILEKNINEMEGDRSCLLRQHIGTIVQNNNLKKSLEDRNVEIIEMKSKIEEKSDEKLKEGVKKYEKLAEDLKNTRLILYIT